MTAPSVRLLADAVVAALTAPGHFSRVYLVEIPKTDPPPEIPNSGGRVQPYCVVYPSGGNAPQLTLAGPFDGLVWPFRVTVVGGHAPDCGEGVNVARAALTGASLTVAGARVGVCLEDEFTTMTMLLDRDVTPNRHFLPLFYRLHADGG